MKKHFLRSLGSKNQITIPASLLNQIGAKKGDYLEIIPGEKEQIIIKKVPVKEDELEQEDVEALLEAFTQELDDGNLTSYTSLEDAKNHLKKLKKKK